MTAPPASARRTSIAIGLCGSGVLVAVLARRTTISTRQWDPGARHSRTAGLLGLAGATAAGEAATGLLWAVVIATATHRSEPGPMTRPGLRDKPPSAPPSPGR